MRSTFRLMPYINRAKTRADGTTAVMLRITIDGKKTVITTDFCCRPELWDAKRGEMTSPTKDANALREFIKKAGLSRLVFLAVDKEILRSNPLEDIEYEKVKRNVEIRYLTREQVKMLLAHPFQQRQMELARHMLLFTVFTGLAYVDLTRLRPKEV